MTLISELKNRSVISLTGIDSKKFLQGLLTNDVSKISADNYLYALMLTPQGRFLYDFFIIDFDGAILLDAQSTRVDEILKKFKMYKLRSDVAFSLTNLTVFVSDEKIVNTSILDPRSEALGYRTITSDSFESIEPSWYHTIRIEHKIPDADLDMIYERSLPMEMGLEALHAIDFQKGCYVGQEVTSRMKYRANIRKGLYHITHTGIKSESREIEWNGRKLGELLGRTSDSALALLNIEESEPIKNQQLETTVGTIKIL